MSDIAPVCYGPAIHPGESVDNRVDDARDLVLDLDAAGRVIGYDIQHASRHPELIAEALALIQESKRAA